nr:MULTISPECIES: relaxase/mobilization nuclease domain-containing protein [Photobacterium]
MEYLLGKNHDREGATLDRGDPFEIQALIDSSPYAKKYTSGVLSFQESDLDRQTKDKIMSSFEKALLPALEPDQYSCLWVEHRDKGRLELNFVIPNIELLTGKRLQPYFDKADRPRINAWKIGMNTSLKLHDPDDPMNKRELVTPRDLPPLKKEAASVITDSLLIQAKNGQLKNREDVISILDKSGFTVVRQTKKSISISDPDGGRNIRLKGMIYEQDFRFGTGLRKEIEGASQRYREQSEDRIQQAREIYRRGVEIKRAENTKRYPRPNQANELVGDKELGKSNTVWNHINNDICHNNDVADQENIRELSRDQKSEYRPEKIREIQYFNADGRWNKLSYSPEKSIDNGYLHIKNESSSNNLDEIDYDGIRKAVIERIREFTTTTRNATQRLCEGLQNFKDDVRDYIKREQGLTQSSHNIKQSSESLERSSSTVREILQYEEKLNYKQERIQDRGMSL